MVPHCKNSKDPHSGVPDVAPGVPDGARNRELTLSTWKESLTFSVNETTDYGSFTYEVTLDLDLSFSFDESSHE